MKTLLMLAAVSLGQQQRPAETQKPQPVQRVDFTEVSLQGVTAEPMGSYNFGRPSMKFKSLLKVRVDFNPELQASVDAL